MDIVINGKSLEDFVRRIPAAVKLNGNDSSDDQSIFTKKDDEDTSKAPKISQEQFDEWLEQTGHDPGFYKQNSGVKDSENLIDKLNNGERRLTDNVIIGTDVWGRDKENGIGGIGGGFRFPGGNEWIIIDGIDDPEDIEIQVVTPEAGGVNGEIDASKQGRQGDCWLLSSLNSLSYTEKGRKIIKDAIEINEDGTYTVNFKGPNAKITVTKEELAEARRSGLYSSGDEDVLLMEIATQKVMDKIKSGEIDNVPGFIKSAAKDGENTIDNGRLLDLVYLLTGHDTHLALADNEISSMLNSLKNNPEGFAMTTSFKKQENGDSFTVKDVNGNPVELSSGHCWSLKSFDGETVTIVNPWDSSKEYKIPKDEYLKHAQFIEYYEFDGDHSGKPNIIFELYRKR